MGSIGPDYHSAEFWLETLGIYALIALLSYWLLYKFSAIRLVFFSALFILSSYYIIRIFGAPKHSINACYYLFIPALGYGVSTYYLARYDTIRSVIRHISILYLLISSYYLLPFLFDTTYETEIAEKLVALSVCIGCYLYVPISIIILLRPRSSTNSDNENI